MKTILLLFLFLTAPLAAYANGLSKDLAACSGIASDPDRLACYDTLAKREAEYAAKEKEWFVSSIKSRQSKTQDVFMSMDALAPVRDPSGALLTPALCIRCSQQKTSVYIMYGARTDGMLEMEEKLDDGRPQSAVWEPAPGQSALHRPGAVEFLKALMKHKTLTLKFLPPNDRMHTVTFPVADLKKAIAPLRKACGW